MLSRPVTEIDDELDEEEDFETDVHLIDQINKDGVKGIAKKCRQVVKKTMESHFTVHSKKRLVSLVQEIEAIRCGNFDLLDDSDEDQLEQQVEQRPRKMSGTCDICKPPADV